jgi:hypothetical protein
MNKRDFFLKGLKSGACKKRAWVMGCFSFIIKDGPRNLYPDYPYRLFKIGEDMYFIDPEPTQPSPATELLPANLTKIDDYIQGEPLFDWLEEFELRPGELENFEGTEPIITAAGNVFVNHLAFCLPFGDIIPYQDGAINAGKLNDKILELLVDDPEPDDGESRHPEGKIYVRQLLMYNEYMLSLTAWAEDNVTPVTPKSLTGHPDRHKVMKELIEQYKDQLDNPSIIARIGNIMEEMDMEYLKDDPSFQFYMSKRAKLFSGSRKKQFYMFGGESPFQDGTSVTFISKSLEEGIDTNNLPTMINSQRAGSFNRGFQTRLGGEVTKTIYRMLGTTRIEVGDCGATIGIPTLIHPQYKHRFTGFYYVENGVTKKISNDNVGALAGKVVDLRDPMACKQDQNRVENEPGKGKNICSICAGDALSEMPDGIPAASAAVGGRFLTLFLKKMHAGSLKTTKWNFQQHIH